MKMQQQGDSWTGSSPQVTQRLYLVIMLSVGATLAFGGFLLITKGSNISTYSLATAAEALYKRSTKIPAQYIRHNHPEVIQARLLELFHCDAAQCGTIQKMGLPGLVRNCVNNEISNLLALVNNATAYLESLR